MKKAILITLLSFLPVSVFSGEVIVLDDKSDSIYLSDKIDFYKDDSGIANFEDVLVLDQEGKFIPNTRENLAFGFSDAAIWGSVDIRNPSRFIPRDWYLYFEYSMTDEIEVYLPGGNGEYARFEAGNRITPENRNFSHRKFIIPMDHANISGKIYFKVKTADDALEIPLYLVSTEGLLKKNEQEIAIHSAYFGILFIIILYFLSIYIAVKDRIYLYYILYAFGMLITQAGIHGFIYWYLTPDNYRYSQALRNLGATSAIVFALLFVIRFLSLKTNFPKFSRIHYFLTAFSVGIYFLCYVAGMLDQQTFGLLFYIIMMATVLLGLSSGVIAFRSSMYAGYYLASWGFFLVVALIFALRFFDINTFVNTLYLLEISDAAQFSLLSFALARRVRMEKMRSDQLEKSAKESRMEILRFRNEILEKNLEFARSLQVGLIPDLRKRTDMNSLYLPMEKVGGDFFDIIYLDENRTGIFFADVSGHGVQASFITAIMKSALSSAGKNPDEENKWLRNPVEAYMKINEIFQGYCKQHFISAIYGVYDKSTGIFEYVSAMHPPLLLFHREKSSGQTLIEFLKVSPQAPLFGVMNNAEILGEKIVTSSVTIPADSWLLFYSDGLFDSIDYTYLNFSEGLDSFKGTPLYDTFRNSAKTTPSEFFADLESKLLGFLNTQAPEDDICLLMISR